MSQMIQALEPRMLMSVTVDTFVADAATITADAKLAAAAHVARDKGFLLEIHTIAAALKTVDTKADRLANNQRVQRLQSDDRFYQGQLAGDMNRLLAAARHVATAGKTHGKSLLAHSTSALLKAVAKDIAYADGVVPAANYALQQELTAANIDGFASEADSIGLANPSMSGVTNAAQAETTAVTQSLAAAANALLADTAQLASDLGAISA